MSKTRLAALGLAALLLAACGPINPGAAAVVDGTRIAMSDVDDVANVYCVASLSGQGGSAAGIDTVGLRRQSMVDLLVGEVADKVAQERGYDLTIEGLPAEDEAQLAEMFGDQLPAALDLIKLNQRTSAVALEMARESDPGVTDEEQLLQIGQKLLGQAVTEREVEVDPRFGLGDDLKQVAETGSLSVGAIELDSTAVEDRPAALQCSA